jgi:Ring finger domain/PA domain
LHDTTLDIYNLRILAVPASFTSLSDSCLPITGDIVLGVPMHGESALQDDVRGKIVVLERGKVSFVQKALAAKAAGAIAIIVTQNAPVWPFLMTDSSREIETIGFELLPTFMISQRDAEVVSKLIIHRSITATIRYSINETACSICQDDMEVGEQILKLHCRHCYHTACVMSWLESHNTCPLCRHEMPKEEDTESVTLESDQVMSFFG